MNKKHLLKFVAIATATVTLFAGCGADKKEK